MPRNSSGTYTLPAGNPVAANTLIETTWANPTMSDLGTGITDSLDRYGRGNMLAALKLNDGLPTAPGMSFASEPSTGYVRLSAGVTAFTILGVPILTLTSAGVVADTAYQFADGTAAAPSITFESDPDTGLYHPNTNAVGIASGGVRRLTVAGDVRLTHDTLPMMHFGTDATPEGGNINFDVATGALQFGLGAAPMRMALDAGNRLLVGTGVLSRAVGAATGRVQAEGPNTGIAGYSAVRNTPDNSGPVIALGKSRGTAAGAVTAVASGDGLGQVQFAGADGVDMATAAAAIVAQANEAFTATNHGARLLLQTRAVGSGGALATRLTIDENLASFATVLAAPIGTEALPGLRFVGDSDTGFYQAASNTIAISNAGAHSWEFMAGGQLLGGADTATAPVVGGATSRLTVAGTTTTGTAVGTIIRYAGNNTGPALQLAKVRGSSGFAAAASGDTLGAVSFIGANGTDLTTASAQIIARAAEAFTASARGGTLDFTLTPNGSTSPTSVLLLDNARSIMTSQFSVGGSDLAGALVVREAGAYGGAGPNTNANTIVAEGNGNIGISLLSPNNVIARIYFGDPENSAMGQITYNHSTDLLAIAAGGANRITTDATSTDVLGALTSTATARFNGATLGLLGVRDGGTAGVTPSSNIDAFVIDANVDTGISILSLPTTTCYYAFGDTDDNFNGGMFYNHATDSLGFNANNNTRLTITSTAATFSVPAVLPDGSTVATFDIGYRARPHLTAATARTAVATDAGKTILIPDVGTYTIPASVFATGDVVYVHYNSGGSTGTVTGSGGLVFRLAGSTSTSASFTLSPREYATLQARTSTEILYQKVM